MPYLEKAIRFAAAIEGAVLSIPMKAFARSGLDDLECFQVMRYYAQEGIAGCRPIRCFDRHRAAASEPVENNRRRLLRIATLVDSPLLRINYDTGNAFLGGVGDPYDGLSAVVDRIVHVHAKDISIMQAESRDLGRVTGNAGEAAHAAMAFSIGDVWLGSCTRRDSAAYCRWRSAALRSMARRKPGASQS